MQESQKNQETQMCSLLSCLVRDKTCTWLWPEKQCRTKLLFWANNSLLIKCRNGQHQRASRFIFGFNFLIHSFNAQFFFAHGRMYNTIRMCMQADVF